MTEINTVEIPPDLLDDAEAIGLWLEYKKERKQSYKPLGIKALWRFLRGIPQAERQASIEQSMANNWSGLFRVKGGMGGRASSSGTAGYQPRKKPII